MEQGVWAWEKHIRTCLLPLTLRSIIETVAEYVGRSRDISKTRSTTHGFDARRGNVRAAGLEKRAVSFARFWKWPPKCSYVAFSHYPSRHPAHAEDSVPYIKNCWAKFRTYLKPRYQTPIPFIYVVELQQSGYAHLHILLDRFIEQYWIKEAWQAVGGGEIVDIQLIDIHRIAPYMSKYLTKDILLASFKPRQRRYSTSRGITLLPKTPSGEWDVLKVLKSPIEFHFALRQRRLLEASIDHHGSLHLQVASYRTNLGPQRNRDSYPD